jgi:hypothetical protein
MLYIVKHTAGTSAGYVAASIADGAAWLPEGTDAATYAAEVAAEVNVNVPGAEAVVEVIDTEAEWEGFFKAEVEAFAAEFGTPNVAKLVAAAEAGVISWFEAYGIAKDAVAAGLKAVEGGV